MTATRTHGGWVTNSPEAARALKAADNTYGRAVRAAQGMALARKIDVMRNAKAARDAAYDAVFDAAGKERT